MLDLIKDKKGSDFLNKVVNQKSENGSTPLSMAIYQKNEDMAKTLLDHGAILLDEHVDQLVKEKSVSMLGSLLKYYMPR